MYFGDLGLQGHFDIFFLGVNRSGPITNSTTNHKFYSIVWQRLGFFVTGTVLRSHTKSIVPPCIRDFLTDTGPLNCVRY